MSQTWEYRVIPKIWESSDDIADMFTMYANEMNLEFVGSIQAVSVSGDVPFEHYVCRTPKAIMPVERDWSKAVIDWAAKVGKKIPEESMRRLRAKK
jgi:hypothetical protein